MPQVFISHASADRSFVEHQLVPVLRLHGVTPWYSTQDVPSASRWESAIRQGLQSSEWFLVVLTPSAVASEWVHVELQWAFENRPNRVVPVLAEKCSPADLSLRLPALQYVDFTTDVEKAREQLLSIWGRSVRDALALEVRLIIRPLDPPDSTEGSGEARTIFIREEARIGRADDADIHLSSPHVSRIHAFLKVREHQGRKSLWLYDLASAGGLRVNDLRMDGPGMLTRGDKITVGDIAIEIREINPIGLAS